MTNRSSVFTAFALMIAVSLMSLSTSCRVFQSGPSRMEKQFPGGEPEGFLEGDARDTIVDDEEEEREIAVKQAPRVQIPRNKEDVDGLFMSVEVERNIVKSGEPIVAICRVRNTTGNTLTINYVNEQRFDLTMFYDEQQRAVAHVWSEGRFFATHFQEFTLSGGAILTRNLEIDTAPPDEIGLMLDQDLSRPVGPGTYYLWATHEGSPFMAAGPIEIRVIE